MWVQDPILGINMAAVLKIFPKVCRLYLDAVPYCNQLKAAQMVKLGVG